MLTHVVGRRFRSDVSCYPGLAVELRRQHENAQDSNALQVIASGPGALLGYIPRGLAEHLAPLLDKQLVKVEAEVLEDVQEAAAPVPAKLQVHLTFSREC